MEHLMPTRVIRSKGKATFQADSKNELFKAMEAFLDATRNTVAIRRRIKEQKTSRGVTWHGIMEWRREVLISVPPTPNVRDEDDAS